MEGAKSRLSTFVLLLIAVTSASCFLTSPSNSGKPPHIIFIVADDLGWNDVGWHNHEIHTPHLNKLAYNGIILNSSYVQPLCTPWHLGFCNWKYTPTYRGFDSFMGFYTGSQDYYNHTRRSAHSSGYDFRWNTTVYTNVRGEYSTHVIARQAVDLINTIDPNKEQLYLYLPFQAVHGPIEVPHHYQHLKPYRHIMNMERRAFSGMVSALDEAVGNITTALKNRGYMNNTLIVFTTDNGGPVTKAANNLPLRGSKATLWEGGTRGAGFVYSDTLLKKTKYVNNEMMHVVDWYPTLLSLAGGKPDSSLDGVNQWPMISEGHASARTEFVYNIDEIFNNSAIRVGKYKLIQGTQGGQNGWVAVPTSRRREVADLEDTSGPQHYPEYMLFDIEADPTEHFDISSQHPNVVRNMKQKLEKYKESLVPANYPNAEPRADPKHFHGVWSPGWC